MKKGIYFLIMISALLFTTQHIFACSPVAGAVYPTPQSVLENSDTAIGVYKITNDGKSVPGVLIVGNENSSMNIVFQIDGSSCGSRFEDFKKGEYIVAIFNKNDDVIRTSELDAQFIYSFNSEQDAMTKYATLFDAWDKREEVLGEVAENGDIHYVVAGKTLKEGMKDDDKVRALQLALKIKLGLGEDFKIDGSYGPATTAAVKRFQKQQNLKEDGIAGAQTQAKLSGVLLGKKEVTNKSTAYVVAGKTLKAGMKDDDQVRALQLALKVKLGLGEDFKIDGSYGPATIAAVKRFQKEQNLKEDGITGAQTQAKLVGTLIPLLESMKGESDNTGDNSQEDSNTSTESQESQENQSNETQEEDQSVNSDIIDGQLKDILSQAKNKLIHYAYGSKDYTNAYALISGYNNQFLNIVEDSDPLYKSSGGGQYFVYSVKLKNGKYACVDNNFQKGMKELDERPDVTQEHVEC